MLLLRGMNNVSLDRMAVGGAFLPIRVRRQAKKYFQKIETVAQT